MYSLYQKRYARKNGNRKLEVDQEGPPGKARKEPVLLGTAAEHVLGS